MNTIGPCMKDSNFPANIAAMNQLRKLVLRYFKSLPMKKSHIIAYLAAMKQLQTEVLKITRGKSLYSLQSTNSPHPIRPLEAQWGSLGHSIAKDLVAWCLSILSLHQIPKSYLTDISGLFQSYINISHVCSKCCLYLTFNMNLKNEDDLKNDDYLNNLKKMKTT